MCSAMVKFLSLIFVCIVTTDGVLCHQEGKKQVSNVPESEPTATTASDPTGAGGQITFVNTGIPIIAALMTTTGTIMAAVIARCVCCPNKCKCNQPVSGPSPPSHDGSEVTPLVPRSGISLCNGDITKKLKCASGVLAIAGVVTAVLLLALIALMVVFIEVYPSYTSSYFAFTDKDGMTILLGTVNTPWYSSVTIEQHEDHFHTTIYVIPSSELKVHECTSSKRCPSGPINTNERIAGRVDGIYLLEGASFDYTMCLNNYSDNATAVAFIFDNETARNIFMDGESDGYQSSVYHQNLPIASGTSVYKCSNVVFTSPHDAFYSVTTEVTFGNSGSTGHQIGSICNITTHIKYFNHSEYTVSCTTLNPSEPCDVNILEQQKSWFVYNTYTMLAFVQEEQFEEHPANLTVQVNKSWYILVLPGGSVLVCLVLFAIIMFAFGVVLYQWRRKIRVSTN